MKKTVLTAYPDSVHWNAKELEERIRAWAEQLTGMLHGWAIDPEKEKLPHGYAWATDCVGLSMKMSEFNAIAHKVREIYRSEAGIKIEVDLWSNV